MNTIEQLPFGRTGHQSTRLVLGAAAFWDVTQAEADATMDLALAYGINHIDVAASYGRAEDVLGDWIQRHGRPFFLATKTGERTAAAARAEIHRSLERLRVDRVDLIQLHNLVDPAEWQTALGPGGALEAAVAARDEGLVGAIGVTGHGWTVAAQHRRALERFDFDSVLLPYSYTVMQDEVYEHDFEALVKTCQERNVAVQTIKSITRGPWATTERSRSTWYQPLENQADIDVAVQWVIGRPGIFLNTVGEIHLLPKVLDAAARFERRPTDAEMKAVVEQEHMTALFV